MKKLIAALIILAMGLSVFGPALAVAGITTELQKGEGGGAAPIVKAKWEMKGPCFSGSTYNNCTAVPGEGLDDSTSPGAQFNASGVWGTPAGDMHYTVCAIVTDPDGVADIYGVYADIYYPVGRAIHAVNPANDVPDQTTGDKDTGCGNFIEENTLIKLSKTDGYELFCEAIRDNNNNLPVFYGSYNYDEICSTTGELMKEEAFVYCDDKDLIWEDPAGDYKVVASALDKGGKKSNLLENYFAYLALTAYEVDFNKINYGQVLLNTHKKISGDLNWDFPVGVNPATVRNRGNTRLQMGVAQDDMGLGKSSEIWNVKYDARVGNYEGHWSDYSPFKLKGTPGDPTTYKWLNEILDLSEKEEMDFSILITKWPDGQTAYTGNLWLSAKFASFRDCTGD